MNSIPETPELSAADEALYAAGLAEISTDVGYEDGVGDTSPRHKVATTAVHYVNLKRKDIPAIIAALDAMPEIAQKASIDTDDIIQLAESIADSNHPIVQRVQIIQTSTNTEQIKMARQQLASMRSILANVPEKRLQLQIAGLMGRYPGIFKHASVIEQRGRGCGTIALAIAMTSITIGSAVYAYLTQVTNAPTHSN